MSVCGLKSGFAKAPAARSGFCKFRGEEPGGLGSVADGERNRCGRATRLGFGRPEHIFSRSRPASDRDRHTRCLVDILTQA